MPACSLSRAIRRWTCLACTLILALGCSKPPAPVAAPSGDQSGYAERYPARLESVRTRFASDEAEARAALAEFPRFPDSVRNGNPALLKDIAIRADRAGRSSRYAESALEGEAIQRFLDEEKEPLRNKVAGGVNYAAKQKECSEDLGGAAVAAMDRGIEKQLEERSRAQNDAFRSIEEHAEELGKANLEALGTATDRLTRTSHIVHVRLELHRRELSALLEDAGNVRTTLDESQRESDALLANDKLGKGRRAAVERHKLSAQQARARLDTDVEQAQNALSEMQQRIAALQDEYARTHRALLDDLDTRAAAKPTPTR